MAQPSLIQKLHAHVALKQAGYVQQSAQSQMEAHRQALERAAAMHMATTNKLGQAQDLHAAASHAHQQAALSLEAAREGVR